MEASKNPEEDNCHQVIFRQLDHIKSQLKCLKCHASHHLCNQHQHTASLPSFRKITEVDNRVVPGQEVIHYKNRHHLDDSEMRKVLRWNFPQWGGAAVRHYQAKRQTFEHEKPAKDEKIVYHEYYDSAHQKKNFQYEYNPASRPPAGYSGKKIMHSDQQGKFAGSKLNTQRSNLDRNGKKKIKNPQRPISKIANDNVRIKVNHNFAEQNAYRTKIEYDPPKQPPKTRAVTTQTQTNQRQFEKEQNHNIRNDFQRQNEYSSKKQLQSRYRSHDGTFQNGYRQNHQGEGYIYSNQNYRRQGYVSKRTTKKKKRINYDDITASSDSYFSPYEQDL